MSSGFLVKMLPPIFEDEPNPMRHLKNDKRYLLTRPRGGLNDALVQLEKSRRYASAYDRVLVLDMSRSGLRAHIDDMFEIQNDFGCEVLIWNEEIGNELDEITSVRPKNLAKRTSLYVAEWDNEVIQYKDRDSGSYINFDHQSDHPETLLVYEQAGGGLAGLCVLRDLAFTADLANAIAKRLIPIGPDYDAIHIRHTDYQTDYENLFRRTKGLFAGRNLLICSDSKKVKSFARSFFHPSTRLLSVSNVPETDGVTLSESDLVSPQIAALDLFSDLVAMARANNFVFTGLAPTNSNGVRFSGFSNLVVSLRAERLTLEMLFRNGDADLLKPLFGDGDKYSAQTARRGNFCVVLRRLFHLLDQWRWNFGAKRKTLSIRNKIRRRHDIASRIGPRIVEQQN